MAGRAIDVRGEGQGHVRPAGHILQSDVRVVEYPSGQVELLRLEPLPPPPARHSNGPKHRSPWHAEKRETRGRTPGKVGLLPGRCGHIHARAVRAIDSRRDEHESEGVAGIVNRGSNPKIKVSGDGLSRPGGSPAKGDGIGRLVHPVVEQPQKTAGVYAKAPQTIFVLVSLLICLIPTTIGGLLSAIGIAGMDRLVQYNVLAMSGRAVEAAGT